MKLTSGVTDQYCYFVAVDDTDFTTRETGLASFTVYRSRDGAAAAAMTTPTINETDASNMPGVYELLLDEDTTIGSGNDTEEMVFHITHAGMAPVTRVIMLERPKITAGETLTVSSGAATTAVTPDAAGTAAALHSTTDGLLTTIDGIVDSISVDTSTTIPASIGQLATGSAGISTVASSFVKAGAEPETNTYAVTDQLDAVLHIVEDDATSTDVYYEFNVGPNGVPVQIEWDGYAQSQGDSYAVYLYNWGATSWDQVGTLAASNGTLVAPQTWSATVGHVGTGANDGLVRLRFLSGDGTAIATDRILCTYTVLDASLGYEGGGVWVDEVAGTSSGTTPAIDGLVTNRSDDFDNAQTIAEAIGYTSIFPTNGNSITLSATINNFVIGWPASNWTVALGGQNISNCDFVEAEVSGTATGTTPHFHDCTINTATLPPCLMTNCGVVGDFTVGSAGAFRLVDCYSGIAGASAPVIDMGAAVGATTLELRRWAGGITLNNLAAGDVVTLDGIFGTITLTGADAEVEIRGIYKALVNNLTGSPSVTQTGVKGADVADILVDTGTTLPATLAGLATPAQVNAEVLDVLNVDTWTEPGQGAPTATPTMREMMHYLFKFWRNRKTNDGIQTTLYADDATTSDQTQVTTAIDDIVELEEWGTGA